MSPAATRKKTCPAETRRLFVSRFMDLEGKAIAAKAEKASELILRSLGPGQNLVPRMRTTMRIARVSVLVRHRDTGPRCFLHVEWRPVTAKNFYRRPFGQHG